MDPEARERQKLEREQVAADFWAQLPIGGFTPQEEALRDALIGALSETGNVRLSLAAQVDEVRKAKTKITFPHGVGLTQWIAQRLADDFALVPDPHTGEKIICVAGTEHEIAGLGNVREDFYSSLPADSFTPEEETLREALLGVLHRLGGATGKVKLSQLTRGEDSNQLQRARSKVLPKGAPFHEWVERRMGSEIEMTELEGSASGHCAQLLPSSRAEAAEAARRMPAAEDKGKGGGKGAAATGGKGGKERVAPWIQGSNATPLWPQAPNLPPPGLKGGSARAAFAPASADDEARKEQVRAEKEERIAAFFQSLPADALTNEEQALRESLIITLEKLGGGGAGKTVRFSLMCQDTLVKDAKVATLPSDVTVATWIEARIGGEIILSKDPGHGQVMAEKVADMEPSAMPLDRKSIEEKRLEKDAQIAAYFEGRPLSHLERSLRASLVEAVASKGAAEPHRLSEVLNIDKSVQEAWKQAKAGWAQEHIQVSFASWVEHRMADQLKLSREPYVSLTKPELEKRGLAKGGSHRKRGGPDNFSQNPYQVPGQGPAKAPRQTGGYGRPAPIGRPGVPFPYQPAGMSANEVPIGPRRGTFKGGGR